MEMCFKILLLIKYSFDLPGTEIVQIEWNILKINSDET